MRKFIGFILAIAVACLMFFTLFGCASTPATPDLPDTPARVLTKFVLAPDLFLTLTIVGIMAGVFAFLNGQKIGIPLIITCGVGMCMRLAVVRFGFAIGLCGTIGSIGLLIYTIMVKDKAIKEIITGIQEYKELAGQLGNSAVNGRLRDNQSKSTEKLVKKIKEKL